MRQSLVSAPVSMFGCMHATNAKCVCMLSFEGLGKRGLAEIIDDCGLRFLVAAQQHASLISALSDHQGAALQHQGLPSAFYIWAFHSKSKQVSFILCLYKLGMHDSLAL